jgi:glucosamine kinase
VKQPLFIGVDGGATKCLVRIEDNEGTLLGTSTSGAANIRISVPQTWAAIESALLAILEPLSIRLDDSRYDFHVGMGLAGCELATAYAEFIHYPHVFSSLTVVSDAITACLGAHNGRSGAIIIIGTGVVGLQSEHGKTTKIGGWGFPHDDLGGGAWLGLEATKLTMQALDGRLQQSQVSEAVFSHFRRNHVQFVDWANAANSTAFASLAPIVIELAVKGDPSAMQLLRQAAIYIENCSEALLAAQHQLEPLPCALLGGVAPFLVPYLSQKLQSRLSIPLGTPDQGAIILARQAFTAQEKPSWQS